MSNACPKCGYQEPSFRAKARQWFRTAKLKHKTRNIQILYKEDVDEEKLGTYRGTVKSHPYSKSETEVELDLKEQARKNMADTIVFQKIKFEFGTDIQYAKLYASGS